ncbi:MAG: sugar phosphate isomerase/epimerase [Acidobacteria bacterium]|nr:sugar phosphate isomerase/epimerase [Acidobacteriota bacterium]
MNNHDNFSRRSFLGLLAAAPLSAGTLAARSKHIPIGLELFSVRDDLKKDLAGTVREVAEMGYQCVEFYAPYYQWTPAEAKQMRREMDNLGIRCYSTHNESKSFTPEGIGKAMELNHILGTRYIVMASPGPVHTLDGWKRVAELLNKANHTLMAHGFHAGYHNDDHEWEPLDGKKPIEIVAGDTDKNIILELDTGNCLASGGDPVAFITSNPGRIRAMHLKDWSPQKGFDVLIGEGIAPWKKIFAAAESVGGVQYYLIEQEGDSKYSEMETARLSLQAYRRVHA